MPGRTENWTAGYFGAQLRKERKKASLTITALARNMDMDDAHLGRIERGLRRPTAEIAARLDAAFPDREGWFSEFYEASQSWLPPAFKVWGESEEKATRLLVWSPGILHGLVQTANYAETLLLTSPGVSEEQVTGRLTARMERQRRVLYRDDPAAVWFVVDELSLYRRVGSPEIMAAQLMHLAEVAALGHVTLTVMPAVEHPANESGFVIADSAAYAESVAAGGVYQDQTVTGLTARFGSLQAESYRASDSLAMIERLGELWTTGGSPLTAVRTAATA
jgi:transcriptional regulator with XRE-family HTH domain